MHFCFPVGSSDFFLPRVQISRRWRMKLLIGLTVGQADKREGQVLHFSNQGVVSSKTLFMNSKTTGLFLALVCFPQLRMTSYSPISIMYALSFAFSRESLLHLSPTEKKEWEEKKRYSRLRLVKVLFFCTDIVVAGENVMQQEKSGRGKISRIDRFRCRERGRERENEWEREKERERKRERKSADFFC